LKPFPLRSLKQRGVVVAVSSDSPCGPSDALHNLRRSVDREKEDGSALALQEALTRQEAVAANSVGAASAIGYQYLGILPGQAADLTICNGDPFDVDTAVIETWIDGRCAWTRETSRHA